jgi:small subunit ribosomal protein S7
MSRKVVVRKQKFSTYEYGFEHQLIPKIINNFMIGGNKAVVQGFVLTAIEKAKSHCHLQGKQLIDLVLEKVALTTECRKKRMGGNNYFIPHVVTSERANKQAIKLIRDIARSSRKSDSMGDTLSKILIDIVENKGAVLKAKEEKQNLITANKVYSHLEKRSKIVTAVNTNESVRVVDKVTSLNLNITASDLLEKQTDTTDTTKIIQTQDISSDLNNKIDISNLNINLNVEKVDSKKI